jgi:hypothetical protein
MMTCGAGGRSVSNRPLAETTSATINQANRIIAIRFPPTVIGATFCKRSGVYKRDSAQLLPNDLRYLSLPAVIVPAHELGTMLFE